MDRLGKWRVSYSETIGRCVCFPLSKICTYQIGFGSCNTTQCIYTYYLALCVGLWEWVLRKSTKNADVLAIAIGVSNTVLCI